MVSSGSEISSNKISQTVQVIEIKDIKDSVIKYTSDTMKLQPIKNMTVKTINPSILNFKAMEYAARGPVIMRTLEIESEMAKGVVKPFVEVIKANLGDAQGMGQKPITFLRQVLALVTCPELIKTACFPTDVKEKASSLLKNLRSSSIGSYTDSRGLAIVREHVAEYITQRDSGILASPNEIFLTAGASDGIRACLKLLKTGEGKLKAGCLVPIPEYPLYNASLEEFDISQVGYYLDESDGWSLNIKELERAIVETKSRCNVRAIVVINPGNPTGHVMSRANIEEVIKFAYLENLVIFADEVYQENVYGKSKFLSFKKVMMEMETPFNSVELFSFFSCSKGYICECGIRGGYFETTNIDDEVKSILQATVAGKLSPTVLGQFAVDCAVNPPKEGTESYPLFIKEKNTILKSFEEKAELIEKTFNSIPGIFCSKIEGAMYAYPQLRLPEKAIKVAKSKDIGADVLYSLELVENIGICVVPGSGLGQLPGTYHFRTTILPSMDNLKIMMEKFTIFHKDFLQRYSN